MSVPDTYTRTLIRTHSYLVESSAHECVEAERLLDERKVLVVHLHERLDVALGVLGRVFVAKLAHDIESSLLNELLEDVLQDAQDARRTTTTDRIV